LENIIKIELFNEVFKFKTESSDINPEAIVDFLVSEVDKAGVKIESNNSSSMKFVQLLLATLNISNKYFELQQKYKSLQSDVSERTQKVIEYIDKNVPD
jgi:cell division protein ZapA (FtsZ GTPase activity inhibitor)